MDRGELLQRTKSLALGTIRLVRQLPFRVDSQVIGKQAIRSSTSVAANYRAAMRARSKAEFYSKLCIVVEEMDETLFWLEMMQDSGLAKTDGLLPEANELLRILAATRKTTRLNLESAKSTTQQLNK